MIYKGKTVFTILAGLTFIIVVVNILLSLGNQSLRVDVSQRQQFIAQTVQLVLERNNLTALTANLETPMQESQKMQTQLQSLVTKTAELANQGNVGARAVVEELEKRGIPIRGTAQPSK